jgi:TP901 family phage tail tape measure protein
VDILEYLVRMRGAAEAAAQMRGLAAEMGKVAGEQARVGATAAEAAAGTSKFGAAAGLAAKGVAAVGIAAVGVGLEAVKMSTQFNHEMLRIRTDAGASTKELAAMKTGVLDLASSGASMGQGPMSLAQGLYHLESLGIRGASALKALALASQESAISGANLEETTTAMGAAMYTGIKGTGDLTKLMGTLNATVGAGNMRFQDLVEALGTGVLPSAKVAGLSIQDVSAALAVATDSGYKASSAAAQMGTAFHFLYAPTTKAAGALASIGLPANRLAQDMHKPQGLLVALRDLHNHLDGLSKVQQAQVLNAILPGGRGRILLTELTMLDRLQGKYKQINATAGGFTGSVAQQRKDPQTQLNMGTARVQADMIRLGNVLGPVVIPALAKLLNVGASVLELMIKLPHAIQDVVHWFSSAGSTGSSMGSTLGKVWDTISHAASQLWTAVKNAFQGIVSAAKSTFNAGFVRDLVTIANAIAKGVGFAFKVMTGIVRAILPGLVAMVRGAFQVIKGIVEVIAGLVTLDFGKMWQGVENIFGGAIRIILGAMKGWAGLIGAAATAAWGALKSGLVDVINWIGEQWNSLPFIHGFSLGPIHIPGLPMFTPIGAPSSGTAPANATTVGTAAAKIGAAHAQHAVHATMHRAAVFGSGDVVIKVGSHEFARVARQEIFKSMAANA